MHFDKGWLKKDTIGHVVRRLDVNLAGTSCGTHRKLKGKRSLSVGYRDIASYRVSTLNVGPPTWASLFAIVLLDSW